MQLPPIKYNNLSQFTQGRLWESGAQKHMTSTDVQRMLGGVQLDTMLGKQYIHLSKKKSVGQLEFENKSTVLQQQRKRVSDNMKEVRKKRTDQWVVGNRPLAVEV